MLFDIIYYTFGYKIENANYFAKNGITRTCNNIVLDKEIL